MPFDRIIAAATQILDGKGADALSMRTLADHLGSGTATLYRHFSGRAELVEHVVDSVMGEVTIEPDKLRDLPWQLAMEELAHGIFAVLKRHPNVALLMVEQPPVGPNALVLRERFLQKLLDSGFAPPLAVRTWSMLVRHVFGFATQITPDVHQAWSGIAAESFPASIAAVEHVPLPLDDEFAFGLAVLITGLDQASRWPDS